MKMLQTLALHMNPMFSVEDRLVTSTVTPSGFAYWILGMVAMGGSAASAPWVCT
jgi:hypothetical protein